MCGRADGITIAQAIPPEYPTSLPTTSPKNKKPVYVQQVPNTLCLQQAERVPTLNVYSENYLLPSELAIAYKMSKFWKFHKLVETRGTSDPEGALSSNISRHGFFSNLMTPVRQTFRHKLVRECDNVAVF
jgi:hypothetical protein